MEKNIVRSLKRMSIFLIISPCFAYWSGLLFLETGVNDFSQSFFILFYVVVTVLVLFPRKEVRFLLIYYHLSRVTYLSL